MSLDSKLESLYRRATSQVSPEGQPIIVPAGVVSAGSLYEGGGRGPSRYRKGRGHGSELQRSAAAQSPWIAHVKEVSAQYGITYAQALKMAASGATGYVKKR